MTPRVAVIGDALIDIIDERHVPGGAALNVAVGLAKLGLSVDLVSMLADDEPGAVLRTYAQSHGVRVHATRAPFGTATATATLRGDSMDYVFNEAGRKRFVAVADAGQAVLAADCVVASCVALEDEQQCEAIESALASRPFVLDANPRDGYLASPSAIRAFGAGLLRLAPQASLLKLSDEDTQLLYGSDPETVAAGMLESGLAAALITEGPRGAKIVTNDGVVSRPIAYLDGHIVDTIGAGDATTAAVTAAMLRHEDWGTALERAMLLAAATCRSVGGELQLP
ncbi:PfkB family carbohydrate kinase [uncultured Agrococcus sp.]|uniref:carbohydrate kinase family protein n=1 Tax=uncultured Agrococcus sp. TaxID=382258 RepID=UPI0025CD403B|nr:PfkB family carbohydrate kinase [uncultured Agrococcus sp.]